LEEIKELKEEIDSRGPPITNVPMHKMKYLTAYATDHKFRWDVDRWLYINDKYDELNASVLPRPPNGYLNSLKLEYQSKVETGIQLTGTVDSSVEEKNDTMLEIGGDTTDMVMTGNNTMRFVTCPNDLDAFFARPVSLGSFTIDQSTPLFAKYDVASLYLGDPGVRAKLRNYAYLRCTFVFRISVSGTPFDYGRLMVSAYPWVTTCDAATIILDPAATWTDLRHQYMSQSKKCAIIDLKENKPVDIELPWVSPVPIGRLYNQSSSALPSATDLSDFVNMWTVFVSTLNTYQSVSTTANHLHAHIYCYMKDVQLGVPTGSQMVLALNSLVTKTDERSSGPIERASSRALYASRLLETVPHIGIYAKASSMVLAGLNKFSALLGWSSPVLMTKPSRVKNEPFQNGVMTIQEDTGQRIVFDPKQELSVSTEYVSGSEDEMCIQSLCAIESFLQTEIWTHTETPGSIITVIPITPQLQNPHSNVVHPQLNVVPTPMNMVSQMFNVWHGDIDITLEVVSSSFHRGKLLITYEPNVWQYANVVANIGFNKQYTQVWDIQETQRFSFCVKWNKNRAWANTVSNTLASTNAILGAISPTSTLDESTNGFVIISPFTALQSPDSSDISINIYVSSKNMAFNRLTTAHIPLNRRLIYNSGVTKMSTTPTSCIELTQSETVVKDIAEHNFGEIPLSLRSILKRFVTTDANSVASGAWAADGSFQYINNIIPNYWGRIGSVFTTLLYADPLGYFRFAYLAMRGSYRKRLHIITNDVGKFNPCSVGLDQTVSSTSSSSITTFTAPLAYEMPDMNGRAIFIPATNAGLEVELPFYSPNYFLFACSNTPDAPSGCAPFLTVNNDMVYYLNYSIIAGGTKFKVIETSASGEDFQLSYFMGSVPYAL